MGTKISIIAASKNARDDLASTVESLLKQTDTNFEFILIDGMSSDGTIDVLEEKANRFAHAPKIISELDKGIYDAYNKGLSIASGDYICYLGCGDKLLPDSIRLVKSFIAATPDADVYYGIIKKYYENGGFTIYSSSPENLFNCSMIAHQASFVKKDVYCKYGGFSMNYKIASDFRVMLKLYLDKGKFVFIDRILAEFKMGGISTRNSDGYYECIQILKENKCISQKEYIRKMIKKFFREIGKNLF